MEYFEERSVASIVTSMLVCLSGSQKHTSKEAIKDNVDTKPMQSYLVPTPVVVATSPPCSVPTTKPGVPPDKNQVPLEVNVVIPPSTKPRDYSFRTAEGPLPRGPLSYEALVHLRRSASTKKTPLCPTVDHTIDLDKHLPVTMEGPNLRNMQRSDRSHSEAPRSKTGPPVVAPKPKNIPANISVKIQNAAPVTSDASYSVKHATDPQVVRLEALQKLGLLKDQQPENETVAPPTLPKPHCSLDPTPSRSTKGPSNVNPSRSPSFCYSQVSSEAKTRPLQSSASFHQCSRHDQQPVSASHPAQSNGLKAASLERSAAVDNDRNNGNSPEPRNVTAAKPVKSPAAAQPEPYKPSNSVGYSVMVVPGMGADRKEALKKLGLLKDWNRWTAEVCLRKCSAQRGFETTISLQRVRALSGNLALGTSAN